VADTDTGIALLVVVTLEGATLEDALFVVAIESSFDVVTLEGATLEAVLSVAVARIILLTMDLSVACSDMVAVWCSRQRHIVAYRAPRCTITNTSQHRDDNELSLGLDAISRESDHGAYPGVALPRL